MQFIRIVIWGALISLPLMALGKPCKTDRDCRPPLPVCVAGYCSRVGETSDLDAALPSVLQSHAQIKSPDDWGDHCSENESKSSFVMDSKLVGTWELHSVENGIRGFERLIIGNTGEGHYTIWQSGRRRVDFFTQVESIDLNLIPHRLTSSVTKILMDTSNSPTRKGAKFYTIFMVNDSIVPNELSYEYSPKGYLTTFRYLPLNRIAP
ncbi:hypothetical protein K2X33_14770 [bacterium]|nr:hypothetical protein [bacterium]